MMRQGERRRQEEKRKEQFVYEESGIEWETKGREIENNSRGQSE